MMPVPCERLLVVVANGRMGHASLAVPTEFAPWPDPSEA